MLDEERQAMFEAALKQFAKRCDVLPTKSMFDEFMREFALAILNDPPPPPVMH